MNKEKNNNHCANVDINEKYIKILNLVKGGMTIQNACIVANINRPKFYRNITPEQKNELRFYKSTTLIHGTPGHSGSRNFMTLEDQDDDL